MEFSDLSLQNKQPTQDLSFTKQNKSSYVAELVIDSKVKEISSKLFSYLIPNELIEQISIGSQVIVPFGKQDLVNAFVISIREDEEKREDLELKYIYSILDPGPISDSDYKLFLYFIAKYYLASLKEVFTAALPSELGQKYELFVRLLKKEFETKNPKQLSLLQTDHKFSKIYSSNAINKKEQNKPLQEEDKLEQIIFLLKESKKELSLKSLKEKSDLKSKDFFQALFNLKKLGFIEFISVPNAMAKTQYKQYIERSPLKGNTKKQSDIIALFEKLLAQNNLSLDPNIKDKKKYLLTQFIAESKVSNSTIQKMIKDGHFILTKEEIFRNPLENLASKTTKQATPSYTDEQEQVIAKLLNELERILSYKEINEDTIDSNKLTESSIIYSRQSNEPWLLHGVTGSGKTEVYLALIEKVLKHGHAALLLVPEISLTPQLAQRLLARFGSGIALWHSGLSAGERIDTWKKIQNGELKLVLGARSAILTKIPKLSLIILDEEHDASYKQSSPSPRYSAKHLALERAKRENALVLLASATPDVSTFLYAKEKNRILTLSKRVHKQPLPESIVVDMREELSSGNRSIISRLLHQEISNCLRDSNQCMLLINRRGYASHIFCRACGQILKCKNCSVSMVFHAKEKDNSLLKPDILLKSDILLEPGSLKQIRKGIFTCHHCGFKKPASDLCPECHSPFLRQYGLGTQKLEEECKELFPNAQILRLDSDIASQRDDYETILETFAKGKADILIGTQMIAKGIDIANVTLVGVLTADAAFNIPDFRALERGFQLITQVSGRAGRGSATGKVILQTYNTQMPILELARKQDYLQFVEDELISRKEFDYPPFSKLSRIIISGTDKLVVETCAEKISEDLAKRLEDNDHIKILGPAPCLIEKVKNLFRYHILIKDTENKENPMFLQSLLSNYQSQKYLDDRSVNELRIAIDIDPLDLI